MKAALEFMECTRGVEIDLHLSINYKYENTVTMPKSQGSIQANIRSFFVGMNRYLVFTLKWFNLKIVPF